MTSAGLERKFDMAGYLRRVDAAGPRRGLSEAGRAERLFFLALNITK